MDEGFFRNKLLSPTGHEILEKLCWTQKHTETIHWSSPPSSELSRLLFLYVSSRTENVSSSFFSPQTFSGHRLMKMKHQNHHGCQSDVVSQCLTHPRPSCHCSSPAPEWFHLSLDLYRDTWGEWRSLNQQLTHSTSNSRTDWQELLQCDQSDRDQKLCVLTSVVKSIDQSKKYQFRIFHSVKRLIFCSIYRYTMPAAPPRCCSTSEAPPPPEVSNWDVVDFKLKSKMLSPQSPQFLPVVSIMVLNINFANTNTVLCAGETMMRWLNISQTIVMMKQTVITTRTLCGF